ncbi:hypothetical protein [Lacibacter sp.]|uniref:hypothetical protein n=1 Tax=Lacibacter sp. TaxID=1915409 RepID=UPI002B4B35F3|nr:hypothetical protein [Lacibacter sp.]HLP37071.1 hypothetical protein [Lacibacter sp.]
MKKDKFKKDMFVVRLLNGRRLYLIILAFIILYLVTSSKILNFPGFLSLACLILSFLVIIVFMYVRYRYYKEYYLRKFRDKFYVLGFVVGIIFFSGLFQFALRVPINLLIAQSATSSACEYYDCRIKSVNTIGYDKISFIFLDKRYSRYYSIAGYDLQQLKSSYVIKLEVKKSILDSYLIESFELTTRK